MRKICLCIFLLTITSFLTGCKEAQTEQKDVIRPVKVFHISGPEDATQRSFPGMVEASQKADLSFQVAGKLLEFPVKEGDKVKEGQLIASLDPTDFEIAVGEAASKAELADVDLDRTKKLLEKQFASQKQYDALKTAADVAHAKLDMAHQNLLHTKIVAAFNGEISKKYVENFQNVRAKEPIAHLQNRNTIDINVQVPESLVIRSDRVKKGVFEAEFETAPGSRYKATVKEISTQANPETQTYSVTFMLPAPQNLNVLPGMTAIIHTHFQLNKATTEEIFTIPISSVFNDKKGISYVWVIVPPTNTLKRQEVKIGRLIGQGIIITAGLSPGQNIVSAGAEFLEEGMTVKPFENSGD